jgi:hypothetical protein
MLTGDISPSSGNILIRNKTGYASTYQVPHSQIVQVNILLSFMAILLNRHGGKAIEVSGDFLNLSV